jgi:hypothetical protein
MTTTEANAQLRRARAAESIRPNVPIVLEHLNRCLPDTDKAGQAWQKALNPL